MDEKGLTEETGLNILKELQALNKSVEESKKEADKKEALQVEADEKEKAANLEKEKVEHENLLKEQELNKKKEAEKLEKEISDKEALEDFRKNVLQEISILSKKDNTEVLTNLDTNLKTVSESLKSSQKSEEISNYSDTVIIFFLMIALPAFLAYKGLSKFFDTVAGV